MVVGGRWSLPAVTSFNAGVMVNFLLCALLWALAGAAKAMSDTVRFHFYDSVFSKLNPEYWNPEVSWDNKTLPGTKYVWDAWHNGYSAMLVLLAVSVAIHRPAMFFLAEVAVLGIVFILSFNLFFNKIFIR
jgi:hypothetical protein